MSFVYFNKGRVGQSLLYTRPLHVWSSTWMYAWEYGLDEGVHGDQSFLLHAPASRFHIDWQASVYLPSKRVWRVCDVRSVCVTNKNCSHKSVSTTSTSILHIPIHKFALRSAHKIFFLLFHCFHFNSYRKVFHLDVSLPSVYLASARWVCFGFSPGKICRRVRSAVVRLNTVLVKYQSVWRCDTYIAVKWSFRLIVINGLPVKRTIWRNGVHKDFTIVNITRAKLVTLQRLSIC